MNTFVKTLLVLFAIGALFYFCPFLFAPLGAIVGATTLVGTIIGLILFALAGVAVTAIGAAISVVAVVAVALSPIWLPILILFGIIHLVRRSNRNRSTPATPIP